MTGCDKVTVRREIEALASDVFDAWLNPDSLAHWMRPSGIERTTARVDPRPGGRFEIVMHDGTGDRIVHTGIYRLIDRPTRLVFTWISPATTLTETLVTVELHAGDGVTTVVVTHERLPGDATWSHTAGWNAALDLLAIRLGPAYPGR